jgi:hypothetical protein
MIKCPNPDCGFENVDGTQFCEGCGEELPQAGAATAAPAAAGDMIKCPACDNLNPAENVVCEVCGSDLKPAASAAPDVAAVTPTGTTSPQNAAGASAAPGPFEVDDTAATTPGPAANAATGSAPAPDASGTASPPVSQMPTGAMTVPGGTSPASAPGGTVPVVAPDAVAGDSGAGQVVASAPATTPFDAMSQQNTGAAPSLGSSTADPSVAANADPQMPGAPVVTATSGAAATSAPSAGGTLEPGKVKFTVEQGMSVGKQFVLGDREMLVGREDTDEDIYPDIDLSDQDEGFVHRRHAQLKFENGALTVTHLGGANKTRVNNRPLPDNQAQPLQIGDKVAFGKVVMRVGAN